MRLNLKVPFAEKDQAKQLGARWDASRKIWFVDGRADLAPFSRWSPTPHDDSAHERQSHPPRAAKPPASSGRIHVGDRYVEQARVCECLPWEVCDKCRALALCYQD